MLSVASVKDIFLNLPPEGQKEFTSWLKKQAAADLPKKKRKSNLDNVPSLEETRQMIHKKHGWV